MLKIGLTGNIAAGKTEVKKIFDKLKIKTLCADELSHFLLEKDEKIIESIKKKFKNFDITTNDKIDRKKLGKIIFSDINKKNELEEIIHPQIIKKILYFFEENKNEKYVVIDIPLLFEGKFEYIFDKIILVYASDNVRIERIKKRNGFDEDHIKKIMKSQLNQEYKKTKSNYIIENDNKSLEELEKEIKNLIKKIK